MAFHRRGEKRSGYRSGTSSREIGPRDYAPPSYVEKAPPPMTAKATAYGVAFVATVLLYITYPYMNPTYPKGPERPDDYPERSIQLSLSNGKNKFNFLIEDYNFLGSKPQDIQSRWIWYSGIEGTNKFKGRGFIPENLSKKITDTTEEILNQSSARTEENKSNILSEIRIIEGKGQRGFRFINYNPRDATNINDKLTRYFLSDQSKTLLENGPLTEDKYCELYTLSETIKEIIADITKK